MNALKRARKRFVCRSSGFSDGAKSYFYGGKAYWVSKPVYYQLDKIYLNFFLRSVEEYKNTMKKRKKEQNDKKEKKNFDIGRRIE